jgi:hypothetical protein
MRVDENTLTKKPYHVALLLLSVFLVASGNSQTMPQLPISKAAELAEKELKARGLSDSHFIKNIILNAGGTIYTANIEPPILADPKQPNGQRLMFVITMDGTVVEWEAWISRDRVTDGSENQKSGPGSPGNAP